MAGTAKAGAAKTSAPPAKLGKAPAKVAPPTKAKPAAKPKGAAAEKTFHSISEHRDGLRLAYSIEELSKRGHERALLLAR